MFHLISGISQAIRDSINLQVQGNGVHGESQWKSQFSLSRGDAQKNAPKTQFDDAADHGTPRVQEFERATTT
jgi:hypothetical protein